jgi:hypothetical protein
VFGIYLIAAIVILKTIWLWAMVLLWCAAIAELIREGVEALWSRLS